MQAPSSVIYFSQQSKPAPKPQKKNPDGKYTAMQWIRNGCQFPLRGGVR